jgi:hypothetical protein
MHDIKKQYGTIRKINRSSVSETAFLGQYEGVDYDIVSLERVLIDYGDKILDMCFPVDERPPEKLRHNCTLQ